MSVPGKNDSSVSADLLDVPGVDVLDAVHVLEVELELVDDEALHLVGAHADVVEEDVDLGDVQRGEDVHPHAVIGQDAAADQGHDHHHGRDRAPHGEDGWIHHRHSRSDYAAGPASGLQTRRASRHGKQSSRAGTDPACGGHQGRSVIAITRQGHGSSPHMRTPLPIRTSHAHSRGMGPGERATVRGRLCGGDLRWGRAVGRGLRQTRDDEAHDHRFSGVVVLRPIEEPKSEPVSPPGSGVEVLRNQAGGAALRAVRYVFARFDGRDDRLSSISRCAQSGRNAHQHRGA